jgi:restriction system protein
MSVRTNGLQVSYSSRGNPTYQLEVWHDGLRKHRVIRGSDAEVVQRKADLQIKEWTDAWARIKAQESLKLDKQRQQEHAIERTEEAQRELHDLQNVLQHTLDVNDAISWDDLKDNSPFPEPKPSGPKLPPKPRLLTLPVEPKPTDPVFQPRFGLLDKLFASRRERLMKECHEQFEAAHQMWQRTVQDYSTQNTKAEQKHEQDVQRAEQQHQADVQAWETRRAKFIEEQQLKNAALDRQRDKYLNSDPGAVVEYCDMVLARSSYPSYFPQEYDLDYNPDNRILVVEYSLPAPESIPTVKEVKYVQSRNELVEQHLPPAQSAKLYDDLLYQIVLRTVHELFEADVVNAIDGIVYNGWVTSIDRGTGQEVKACVLSLQTRRQEFTSINLRQAEPKACFKSLKGVGSSKLHSLAAVPPIMRIRRDDGRFVSAYEVAHTLDESQNLAAMDWEDFEHLIREIFEKEFSTSGGEVKVTRASRDGGVDAVAFDPDPIRGGKLVIQAKRYTHTVGVGAVRDLYGTVMNEGANKGILVTTSDYGPDAYAFANGKPLVLINGANLLHLLEKHGHRARIDLQEARTIAANQPVQ